MAGIICTLRRRTQTLCLLWCGRFLNRCGGTDAARRLFERAATLCPERFQVHFQLGRVALPLDEESALHRFRIAYNLDPHRFLASRLPIWVRERVILDEFERRGEEDDEPEWEEILLSPDPDFGLDSEDPDEVIFGGDFRDLEEWMRFQGRPPLSRREIEEADLDALMTRLFDAQGEGEGGPA